VGEQSEWARMALRMENLAAELVEVHDVDDTLEGVLKLTVWMAPCDVASVSLRHRGGKVETTAASDAVAKRAHELQQEIGEGPCLDVVWDEEGVNVISDLADTRRWPRWAEHATQLGLSSMVAVRLFTKEQTIGALDLYSHEGRDYDTDDLLAARVVAARVSAVLARAQHEQTLWEAIDSRHQIGQAQGVLMERYDLSADQAFAVLRRYSQEQNRKLRVVAQDVIATRHLPGGPRISRGDDPAQPS
jgi:transcriptional regulator with GAF, ATPase, and Fis domain